MGHRWESALKTVSNIHKNKASGSKIVFSDLTIDEKKEAEKFLLEKHSTLNFNNAGTYNGVNGAVLYLLQRATITYNKYQHEGQSSTSTDELQSRETLKAGVYQLRKLLKIGITDPGGYLAYAKLVQTAQVLAGALMGDSGEVPTWTSLPMSAKKSAVDTMVAVHPILNACESTSDINEPEIQLNAGAKKMLILQLTQAKAKRARR
ncbi:hypothetical protein B0O99DRAFT_668491 [Bisporella sp. PMI_857]|nr:hypothetical protein B0O99DRAFT_668808 [Bisporella sp. PMI_857]KAH8600600.1 hypothetical protein B0O99DRAFT_668491 [Bisporella sp. PMI_857]